MREPFFAQLRCIFKTFVAECCQFLGSDRAVVQDESCHGPAAGLGPDGLHLQSAIFLADIEEGVDDLHFAAHSFPVEQMFIFLGGQVDEDAVVRLDAVYQDLGQFVFPELVDGFVLSGFQGHAVFHPIGYDAIQGPEQAIEEAGNPEMVLCILQGFPAQCIGTEVLVGLSVVGEDGRHFLRGGEVPVTCPVDGGNLGVTIQLSGQFFHLHSGHLGGQHVGNRLEKRRRERLAVGLLVHNLGVG